ncbi:hypothetical protein EGW08_004963 [Elysia chlorotica]|uniref:WAP domain-containing protein n=1 Tax=Elysia chlorotica TaxID=188477 RepID=A0A3S1BMT7_ELYCH|nr:hypothetical protein EGW08_004963 [Elysia chlorotica]
MSYTKRSGLSSLCVVALLLIGWFESFDAVILPPEVCAVSSTTYRLAGCIGKNNAFCRLLAFQLNFVFENDPLCVERPCTGFGTNTHECKGLLDCPLPRIFLPGVCNGLDICCRKADVDPSVDAEALEQADDMLDQVLGKLLGKSG